jgi:hypothetical protein
MRTSDECLAKAAELERTADSCLVPALAAEYKTLACQWRIVALRAEWQRAAKLPRLTVVRDV